MCNIFDVAKWFLEKESMEHKKLQKLCYYAQSWSLAINNKKLFDDKFEGWAHGPVCRVLWNRLKSYNQEKITAKEFESSACKLDEEDIKLLDRVWNTYCEYDGIDLECMTHKELPWINSRKGLSTYQAGTVQIEEEDMKNYYHNIYSGDGLGE